MSWRLALNIVLIFLPWKLRRAAFIWFFGYQIDRTAFIGRSLILCRQLSMGPKSIIGPLNIIRRVDKVTLAASASIGSMNWISAIPMAHPMSLKKDVARVSELSLGEHASITNRHILECSDRIYIGAFSTVGGWRSQLITRGLDIKENRQAVSPLTIGRYCLVGTGSILLKGAYLPDYSVLAAGSVLAGKMAETYSIYSGVPAARVRALDPTASYFLRTVGFVH